jgi:hypothetical protein
MENLMKTDIGTFDLSGLEVAENFNFSLLIPIAEVSENLRDTVKEEIKHAKEEYQKELNANRIKRKWSKSGVEIITQYLSIDVKKEGISYGLYFAIGDKEDEMMYATAHLVPDMSEYDQEFKKLVLKTFIDKIF